MMIDDVEPNYNIPFLKIKPAQNYYRSKIEAQTQNIIIGLLDGLLELGQSSNIHGEI